MCGLSRPTRLIHAPQTRRGNGGGALGVFCINFIISYKGVITGVIDVVQYMTCVPR